MLALLLALTASAAPPFVIEGRTCDLYSYYEDCSDLERFAMMPTGQVFHSVWVYGYNYWTDPAPWGTWVGDATGVLITVTITNGNPLGWPAEMDYHYNAATGDVFGLLFDSIGRQSDTHYYTVDAVYY